MYKTAIANNEAITLKGIGSIFIILLMGKYGMARVSIATANDVKANIGAGLLLKKGLFVRITNKVNSSVKIDSTNQPL